ncbi:MAG TPA: hypothetical protein VHG71_08075 [Verrucomicrobiae bacterium]|nr:hypothetical protein [Verrucomicrobiae bacterium]
MRLPRPIKNSLLPLLLIFGAQKLCAQLAPADDFFNSGAQFYISNNIPTALTNVEQGLKIYPNDEKLQKLEKLLKQQQQSQSQQNQQNQQNQSQQQQSKNNQSQKQNSQSQQNQSQQQSKDNQQQQQNSDEQQKQDAQKQQQDKQQSEQAKNQADKNRNQKNEQNQTGEAKPMTPEEAKRLLDAQKGDEQFLQMKPKNPPPNPDKPVKDW